MARLGGLMSAVTSGGEAQPNFPDFNKVMMITGEVKEPRRVLPVFGFNGQQLWASEVGMKLGDQDEVEEDGLSQGDPLPVRFNWMDKEQQHVEGGRYLAANQGHKRRKDDSSLKVGKRIRQNISVSSDEDDLDEDYAPAGTVKKKIDFRLNFTFAGKVKIVQSERKTRKN